MQDNHYDEIAFQLTRVDQSKLFIQPVKKENVPNYYEVIKNPMDLDTMRAKAKRGEYHENCLKFVDDLNLIVNNAVTFNGEEHFVS